MLTPFLKPYATDNNKWVLLGSCLNNQEYDPSQSIDGNNLVMIIIHMF